MNQGPPKTDRPDYIVGPLGQRMTIDDLPPPDLRRWLPMMKAQVVAAVDGGLLTADEACLRYGLSPGEIATWRMRVAAAGVRGLRITKTQKYRDMLAKRQQF